jgi:hypothetical protein
VPFVPDILVTSSETPGVLVAVEARTNEAEFRRIADEIRQYLFRMSSPVGLIVFPDRLWVFHNKYSGTDDSTIEQLGPYELSRNVWKNAGVAPNTRPELFEASVQVWLEHLAATHDLKDIAPDLGAVLERHVFPALSLGVVRAAGPRSFLEK